MAELLTISKRRPGSKSLDYRFLFEEGIRHIQELSGGIWTDHNAHDPGITLLEHLCFSLTDLGYRASHSIEDILAAPPRYGQNVPASVDSGPDFHTAAEILPGGATTVLDFRKLLLDLPEVQNARLQVCDPRYFHRGLYQVEITPTDPEAPESEVREAVAQCLQANRPLGEDFSSILVLRPAKLRVCATIDIDLGADVERVLAHILLALRHHLAPRMQFLRLQEMLRLGYAPDEIWSGPKLAHGFLEDAAVLGAERKTAVYVSDVISLIMAQPGVQSLRTIWLEDAAGQRLDWRWEVPAGCFPVLDGAGSDLQLFKRRTRSNIHPQQVEAHLTMLDHPAQESVPGPAEDLYAPAGQYLDLAEYVSLQQDLPRIYGLGDEALDSTADIQNRDALALQLKGYLLFFEQHLANFTAQLANLKQLFSPDPDIRSTMFQQIPDDIPRLALLYKDFTDRWFPQYLDKHPDLSTSDPDTFLRASRTYFTEKKVTSSFPGVPNETEKEFIARRNRFLDHLAARYGETLTEHTQMMTGIFGKEIQGELLRAKAKFLQHYPELSRDRGRGIDPGKYAERAGSNNLSGLEKRLRALLGMPMRESRDIGREFNRHFHGIKYPQNGQVEEDWEMTNSQAVHRGNTYFLGGIEGELDFYAVLRYGERKKYYDLEATADQRYRILLYDDQSQAIAQVGETFSEEGKGRQAINRLQKTIQQFGKKSEGFYLVEHILLRPLHAAYGFDLATAECGVVMDSAAVYTQAERKSVLEDVMEAGKQSNCYEIEENGDGSCRLLLKNGAGDILAQSGGSYSSAQAAQAVANSLMAEIEGYQVGRCAFEDVVTNWVEPGHGLDRMADPYAYQVSMVLPDWPPRFQSPAFRRYIGELIQEEMPAHVLINVRWLHRKAFQEFETLHQVWRKELAATAVRSHAQEALAADLLKFLI